MADENARRRNAVIPLQRITRAILLIRGQKVMLDEDLADLYRVETKTLNRAVRRNLDRFPPDFMFQLTAAEFANLRYQSGTSSPGAGADTSKWGGRRYPPFAFSGQGVAMLSTVLNSARAIQVNIEIMRAFVRLRHMLASNATLARKLAALEEKCDTQFKVVFETIGELMAPRPAKKRPIGFASWEDAA